MKRKTAKVRLSPNEESLLAREELERRRKLRLQQVREQERFIALQLRRSVTERRERELRSLGEALRGEWQHQRGETLQALERVYQDSLRAVGQGHRSAKDNEPDWEALARRAEEGQSRAEERHRKALRELTTHRHTEEEQRSRFIKARRKALLVEKERAARLASLPLPPPNPIENIGVKPPPTGKMVDVERFSATLYHMPETAVDREAATQQDAREAAEVEAMRLEELGREEARDRQEQLEKARLRGSHALRKEQHTQDRERLLVELERMQQADLLRRRLVLNSTPAQIFQPLSRRDQLRDEQQRELDQAFQDLYTGERRVKGDLVLQLVPEPLPALSTGSQDDDLDVTLDPDVMPREEGDLQAGPGEGAVAQPTQTEAPRQSLRRLLDRVRTQRAQWNTRSQPNPATIAMPTVARSQRHPTTVTAPTETDQPTESGLGEAAADGMTIETGSLTSEEREQIPDTSQHSQGPGTSEESIVAGTLLRPEEQADKILTEAAKRRERSGVQEQLALLQQLEQQRLNLEEQRKHLQQVLQTAAQQEEPEPRQDVPPAPQALPTSAPVEQHTHHQRLQEQNRLHRQCVEDARRRLEEYQRTLRLRYSTATTTAPPLSPVTATTAPPFFPVATTSAPPHSPVPATAEPPLFRVTTTTARQLSPVSVGTLQSLTPLPDTDPPSTLTLPTHSVPPSSLTHTPHTHTVPASTLSPLSADPPSTSPEPSEQGQVELPPPSVVLELLMGRRPPLPSSHPAPLPPVPSPKPAPLLPTLSPLPAPVLRPAQASLQPGAFLRGEAGQEEPCWAAELQRPAELRRRQRDALQALLNPTHTQPGPEMLSGSGSASVAEQQFSLISALLRAIDESNGLLPPPAAANHSQSSTPALQLLSNDPVSQHAAVSRKPPVSRLRPSLRLLDSMATMEQHELSAIQEVDSLNNTVPEECVEVSEAEDSSSVSLPSLGGHLGNGAAASEGSGEVSGSAGSVETGHSSRLSWRERLRLDTAESGRGYYHGPAIPNYKLSEELELFRPSGGMAADPDYLSSTTISTGSYSTNEQDPNYTAIDSSLVESGAGILSGSPAAADCMLLSNSVQRIIQKYTTELNTSLRTAGKSTGEEVCVLSQAWSTVLQQDLEHGPAFSSHSDHSPREQSPPQTASQSDGSASVHLPVDHRRLADFRSSMDADISSFHSSGHFLPLQALPDSDSSSSSQHSERPEQNRRAKEWDDSVSRIIGHLSDQSSTVGVDQDRDSVLSRLIGQPSCQSSSVGVDQDGDSSLSRLIAQLWSQSSQASAVSGNTGRDSSDSVSRFGGQLSDQSSSLSVENSKDSNVSQVIGQLADHSSSHWLTEGQDSSMSQLIGQASDLQSSQVLDESRALIGESSAVLQRQSSAGGVSSMMCEGARGPGPTHTPLPLSHTPTHTPQPPLPLSHTPTHTPQPPLPLSHTPTHTPQPTLQEGKTPGLDSFLPLPAEVTLNETAECSVTFRFPCSASPDLSDPSLNSDLSPERPRADGPAHSQQPLQDSPDQLLMSHSELVVSPVVRPHLLTSSTCLHDDDPGLDPPVRLEGSDGQGGEDYLSNQSAVRAKVTLPPWERILEVGGGRGILEESALSLVNLTETTLQDQETSVTEGEEREREGEEEEREGGGLRDDGDLEVGGGRGILEESALSLVNVTETTLQEQETSVTEGEEREREEEEREGGGPRDDGDLKLKFPSSLEEKDRPRADPELSAKHAMMLLEFQSSPSVSLQEAFQRRRRDLGQRSGQRSAHRAEVVKARRAESKWAGPGTKTRPTPAEANSVQKQEHAVGRLQRVAEVKISTPEPTHLEEHDMYQRTERLCSQLEEVRQRKELRSRQESYARNREKAKEFQKKTLQKLRAKQTPTV